MKKINILLIVCILFAMVACSLDTMQNKIESKNKATLQITFNESRTINPKELDKTTLSYKLSGVRNGKNKDFGEFTYQQLMTINAEINVGKWDFTLVAKKSDKEVLSGFISQYVIVAGNNTLSFTMQESATGTGDISITVLMPKNSVAKTEFVLLDKVAGDTADSQNGTIVDSTDDDSKSKSVYQLSNVNKGYYNLKINLYQNADDTTPINTRLVVVRVEPGCVSTGTVVFEKINSKYKIIYHFNGIDLTSDYILPTWYNGSMYITLPTTDDMSGDVPFYGWYDNVDFKGSEITKIEFNSSGDKEYWAKTNSVLCSNLAERLSTYDVNGGPYTIFISDANPDLAIINSALQSNPNVKVNLDLSLCNGLKTIESNAFKDCSNLTSFVIPDTVTSIGSSAFSGCNNLEHITIPFVGAGKDATTASNQTLFGYIFGKDSYSGGVSTKQYYRLGSYETYYIPSSLKSVRVTGGQLLHGAFFNCSNLTSVEIGDNVIGIEQDAFQNCSGLSKVVIGDNITTIGESAFSYCSSLTSVELGNNVISVEKYAFRECCSLTSIELGDRVTNIGQGAFSYCIGLTSVEIGDSVTSIGDYAFSNCNRLTTLTCKATTPPTINSSSLSGCSKLSYIYVPVGSGDVYRNASGWRGYKSKIVEGLTIKVSELENCLSTLDSSSGPYTINISCDSFNWTEMQSILSRYPNIKINLGLSEITSLTTISKSDWSGCIGVVGILAMPQSLVSVELPDSITSIGEYAFYNCSCLTSVELPDSVTSIGEYAYYNCSCLTSVYYNGTLAQWCGIIFSNSSSNPLCNGSNLYINNSLITSVVIPNGVTSIGSGTFSGCSGLTSVVIPNGVTSIGGNAFTGCGLTSIVLPDSITNIENFAFFSSNLSTLTCKATTPPILGTRVFDRSRSLSKIYVPSGSVDAYKTADGWSDFASMIYAIQ